MRNNMPRKRKYDYKTDLPVRKAIYVKLPIEIMNILEDQGLINKKLSEFVEKILTEYAEKYRKKD